VNFKGMLTSFQDSYTPHWQEEEVYGRMDPVSNFRNTKRTITIGWDLLAASLEEAMDNAAKTSLLIQMLYPSYSTSESSDASTISAGPLLKMSFTNLVQNSDGQKGSKNGASGLVGYISNTFSPTPVIEDGFFDPKGCLYPMHSKCSIAYTVLHTAKMGWDSNGNFRTNRFPYGLKTGTESGDKKGKAQTKQSSSGNALGSSPNEPKPWKKNRV
jgi:hypothetical protein